MDAKVWVFDLDGTLVDTMEKYSELAGKLISSYYCVSEGEARELYKRTSGRPFKEQLLLIFGKDFKNYRVWTEFERRKALIIKKTKINKKILKVLEKLKKRGKILAISSNNLQKYVEEILKKIPIEFNFILGWDGRSFKKGERHFKFLEKKLKISRKEFVFIGDSFYDYLISKRCGVRFLWARQLLKVV